jgi:hypothetical protein
MYGALVNLDVTVDNINKVCKVKIPLKTKIFTWYLHKGVIFTKDNLVKNNWHTSKKNVCSFIMTTPLNTYSSNVYLLDLYG